jgi:hypothetical protein
MLGAAGCGRSTGVAQRALDAFFRDTPRGRAWTNRFPHEPGSTSCTAVDPTSKLRVAATCSTDLSLGRDESVLATFTVSWSHGSRAKTWFVFLRHDGTIVSVRREGEPG